MTDVLRDRPGLGPLLAAWLPAQRWFGGKHLPVDAVRVAAETVLSAGEDSGEDVRLHHLIVDVDQVGGTTTYQVPVSVRRQHAERLERVLVGELDGDLLYDGLQDKATTAALLGGFSSGRVGDLAFHVEPEAEIPYGEASIVLNAEQSNTSVVFGDAAILKVFRRLAAGLNPDIEVHDALTRAGSTHVAALLGWVDGSWESGSQAGSGVQSGSLAMLQRFLVTATDGWSLASASVRDLFAEADLHADEVGGDFAAEAHRLGAATAEVHVMLAGSLETGTLVPADLTELAAAMHHRLDAALDVVPDLAGHAAGLRTAYDAVAALADPVPVQRVHGDYHLGQVLRTSLGWKLLDFEGEPERPLAERRLLDSPLRDVAGMLRSFDYAARHLLMTDHPGDSQIAYRAAEWSQRNRRAFRAGWAETSGRGGAADEVLLRAYETDKAVYEAVYEARNRPRWLPVPMAAVERLAADRSSPARPPHSSDPAGRTP